ncbi:AsnC family transcriptional regulator [Stieleria sp. JC731]|nr:ECF-type sigma factor [Stieleria sp. JC731]MCC9599861.1 AsnC family transcriptional regulator [Stieleria sp. JC731]
MNNQDIESLLRKAVEGCEDSTTRFVKEFESQIRLEIRTRIASSQVRRMLDSVDIAQSVFTDFLIASRTGSIAQLSPNEAIAKLFRASREKVQQKIRFHTARKRDIRRDSGTVEQYQDLTSAIPEPTDKASEGDLKEFLHSRFGSVDYRLVEMRMQGCSWSDIAEELGLSPDACRMRLQRLRAHWPQDLAELLPQPRD